MQNKTSKNKDKMPGRLLFVVLFWLAWIVLAIGVMDAGVKSFQELYEMLLQGCPCSPADVLDLLVGLMLRLAGLVKSALLLFLAAVAIGFLARFLHALEEIAAKTEKPRLQTD